MQYYQFHIGDYTTATVHLTPLEDLAYRRLIDFYYMTEKPIPLKTEWVSRRLRLGLEEIENVLEEFFEKTPEGYKNARCDEDLEQYRARADRARANGKRGGRPQKNPKETQQKPSGFEVGTQKKASRKLTNNHKPLTINQEPSLNTSPENSGGSGSKYSNDFEDFWKAYERKGSKSNAFKRWRKLTQGEKHDALFAIDAYFLECREPQFRKDAEGYLNGKLFEGVIERQREGINNLPGLKLDDRETRSYGLND